MKFLQFLLKKRPLVLVDYENVQNKFLEYLDDSRSLEILVFFTANNEKMDLQNVENILKDRKDRYFFKKVSCGGKNALDFQLASYLGYLISQDKNREYIILSKDTGYDHVVDFWKRREINIKRRPITNIVALGETEEEREHRQWLINFGGSDLQTKHKALVKKYGAKQGLKLYHEYKEIMRKRSK